MAVRLLKTRDRLQQRGQGRRREPARRAGQTGQFEEPAGDVAAVVGEDPVDLERDVGPQPRLRIGGLASRATPRRSDSPSGPESVTSPRRGQRDRRPRRGRLGRKERGDLEQQNRGNHQSSERWHGEVPQKCVVCRMSGSLESRHQSTFSICVEPGTDPGSDSQLSLPDARSLCLHKTGPISPFCGKSSGKWADSVGRSGRVRRALLCAGRGERSSRSSQGRGMRSPQGTAGSFTGRQSWSRVNWELRASRNALRLLGRQLLLRSFLPTLKIPMRRANQRRRSGFASSAEEPPERNSTGRRRGNRPPAWRSASTAARASGRRSPRR